MKSDGKYNICISAEDCAHNYYISTSWLMGMINKSKKLAPLHGDARFTALLERIKVHAVTEAAE